MSAVPTDQSIMWLFHWDRLETCKGHATGDAVVMAPDLETARVELRKALREWAAEHREWEWRHGDEDDRAMLENLIEGDVASSRVRQHPGPHAVILRGSD